MTVEKLVREAIRITHDRTVLAAEVGGLRREMPPRSTKKGFCTRVFGAGRRKLFRLHCLRFALATGVPHSACKTLEYCAFDGSEVRGMVAERNRGPSKTVWVHFH